MNTQDENKRNWVFDPVSAMEQADAMERMIDRLVSRTALLAMFVGPMRELCYEIEKLPASEQQTKTIILASDIQKELESIAQGKKGGDSINPMSETVQAYRKARVELETEDV